MRPPFPSGTLRAMKICIQHGATRKFLREADAWTDSNTLARLFANSLEAFRHCVQHGLSGVNIIVERQTPRPPIVIPVEISATTGQATTGFPMVLGK
jgi:hypothetical protein